MIVSLQPPTMTARDREILVPGTDCLRVGLESRPSSNAGQSHPHESGPFLWRVAPHATVDP